MGSVTTTMAFVLVIVVLIGAAFYSPRFLARRALRRVLSTFRRLEALDPDHAVTSQKLGIPIDRSLFNLRMGLRDYRPAALRMLLQADIVRMAPDGKMYLSMASLRASNLRNYAEGM